MVVPRGSVTPKVIRCLALVDRCVRGPNGLTPPLPTALLLVAFESPFFPSTTVDLAPCCLSPPYHHRPPVPGPLAIRPPPLAGSRLFTSPLFLPCLTLLDRAVHGPEQGAPFLWSAAHASLFYQQIDSKVSEPNPSWVRLIRGR